MSPASKSSTRLAKFAALISLGLIMAHAISRFGSLGMRQIASLDGLPSFMADLGARGGGADSRLDDNDKRNRDD